MGKGDIKTKRGKIRAGSFGNLRPRKKTKKVTITKKEAPKKAAKKEAK